MIRYALICAHEHTFEAWFSSADDYDQQHAAAQVQCPYCGDHDVRKQIMAPALKGAKKADASTPMASLSAMARKIQETIRKTHDYVGSDFAKEARAMHNGEKEEKPIYGQTTPAEAKALHDEGVPATPLPPAFAPTPPKKVN